MRVKRKYNIRMHSSKLEFYEVFQKKKKKKISTTKVCIYIEIYISHIDDFSLEKLYTISSNKYIFADGSRNWLGCR